MKRRGRPHASRAMRRIASRRRVQKATTAFVLPRERSSRPLRGASKRGLRNETEGTRKLRKRAAKPLRSFGRVNLCAGSIGAVGSAEHRP